jgi:hypothetical protein
MPERSELPASFPHDKEYAPRSINDSAGRAADQAAAAAAQAGKELHASNDEKFAYGAAQARYIANYFNCAVLAHFHALPHCQWNGPTLAVAFVPADRTADISTAPDPGV